MKITPGIILIFLLLQACQPPTVPQPQSGQIDTLAIAQDTTTQLAIENSYEAHRTITVHSNLVYDVIAHGTSASEGYYTIIRRSSGNKADTVGRGERNGVIVSAFTADLNQDHTGEIYIITQSTGSGSYAEIIAYDFEEGGKSVPVETGSDDLLTRNGYMGKDSIYAYGNFLIREFPVFRKQDPACCPAGGRMRLYYVLRQNNLSIIRSEKI